MKHKVRFVLTFVLHLAPQAEEDESPYEEYEAKIKFLRIRETIKDFTTSELNTKRCSLSFPLCCASVPPTSHITFIPLLYFPYAENKDV